MEEITNEMRSVLKKLSENLIGQQIAPTKASDEPYNKPYIKINPNLPDPTPEEWAAKEAAEQRFHDYLGDRHDPFDISILSDEDIANLKSHGVLTDDNQPARGLEFFMSNDRILRMCTGRHSWMALAGRDYYYDLDTKKFKLWRMS